MFAAVVLLLLQKHPPKTVDLRIRAKVGDSYDYEMTATVTAVRKKGSVIAHAAFTRTLTKIVDGNFYWDTTFHVGRTKAFGVLQPQDFDLSKMDGVTMTMVENDRAEILRGIIKGVEVPGRTQGDVTFPGRRVKVGDSWDSRTNMQGGFPVIRYTLTDIMGSGAGTRVVAIKGSLPPSTKRTWPYYSSFYVDTSSGAMLEAHGGVGTSIKSIPVASIFDIKLRRIRLTNHRRRYRDG
jgi:hypothetical protein